MRFALRTVKFMDDYIANPCYALLLITGGAMVYVSGYPWTLKWIYLSLGLLILAFAIAHRALLADAAAPNRSARGERIRRIRNFSSSRSAAAHPRRHPRRDRHRDRRADGVQAV